MSRQVLPAENAFHRRVRRDNGTIPVYLHEALPRGVKEGAQPFRGFDDLPVREFGLSGQVEVAVLGTVQMVEYGDGHILAAVVAAGGAVVHIVGRELIHRPVDVGQFTLVRVLEFHVLAAVGICSRIEPFLPVPPDRFLDVLRAGGFAAIFSSTVEFFHFQRSPGDPVFELVKRRILFRHRQGASVAAHFAVQAIHQERAPPRVDDIPEVLEVFVDRWHPVNPSRLAPYTRAGPFQGLQQTSGGGKGHGPFRGRIVEIHRGKIVEGQTFASEVAVYGRIGDVVITQSGLDKLPLLGHTGGYRRNLVVPV